MMEHARLMTEEKGFAKMHQQGKKEKKCKKVEN